jgi:ferredoxin
MSDAEQTIRKVWIEPGCIVCNACESNCPEVFHVDVESSTIRPEALNAEFLSPLAKSIRTAAEECPVEVIKFETGGAE